MEKNKSSTNELANDIYIVCYDNLQRAIPELSNDLSSPYLAIVGGSDDYDELCTKNTISRGMLFCNLIYQ